MSLRGFRQAIASELRADTVRGRLGRSAVATTSVRIAGSGIAFAASLLYARILGPRGYGVYNYILAWAALLTIPAGLGIPNYLIREGAKVPSAWMRLRRWADRRTLAAGIAAALIILAAASLPSVGQGGWLFALAAPLPLLNNLALNRQSLLQAHGRVARSQWAVLVFAPGLMLAVLAALWYWRDGFTTFDVVVATVGAALLALATNDFQLKALPAVEPSASPARVSTRSALPFMWLGMLFLITSRTDVVMLGSIRGAHAAGIYSVAARVAEFVPFFLAAANQVIAPRIASYYHAGERRLLQRLLTGSSQRVFLISLPATLTFIFAAHPLLYYLYGSKFAEAAVVLQILAAAQLLNVTAGSVGTVLNMAGFERLSSIGVGISAAVNVGLNAVLVPFYGVEGAAVATGISLVLWNTLLWYWVRRRLGLRPSALGF